MNLETVKKEASLILASSKSADEKRRLLLGRRGLVTAALRSIGQQPAKQRKSYAQAVQQLQAKIEKNLKTKKVNSNEMFDLSAPAKEFAFEGSTHPISQTISRMIEIFHRLGFEVATGPEIVTDYDNFGSLHFPADHPARDTQDSFLIKGSDRLLRTQTSAMQVPVMSRRQPPLRVVVPGRTYRREADATHQPMFYQLEGFIVDESVTFADLKGILTHFVTSFFGPDTKMRFRPHYFPFTEPSAEIDIEWQRQNEPTRWLEIAGCGCIHPEVLRNAGLNPRRYLGVAFGFGVERPFLLRHRLDDIRLLYENREHFLSQFNQL